VAQSGLNPSDVSGNIYRGYQSQVQQAGVDNAAMTSAVSAAAMAAAYF
jgi:hypothetical protein